MVCNKKKKKEKPVFIKRKWNHVVFSRATILLFNPVLDAALFNTQQGKGKMEQSSEWSSTLRNTLV